MWDSFGEFTSDVSTFVEDTWDAVETGVKFVTDAVGGEGTFATFSKWWDDTLGVDWWDSDNEMTDAINSYAEENLIDYDAAAEAIGKEQGQGLLGMASDAYKGMDPETKKLLGGGAMAYYQAKRDEKAQKNALEQIAKAARLRQPTSQRFFT